jgi:hypothetical protein
MNSGIKPKTSVDNRLPRGLQFLENKLGASPQLECWNTGILEKWVLTSGFRTYGSERMLDCWVNGDNRFDDRIKNG